MAETREQERIESRQKGLKRWLRADAYYPSLAAIPWSAYRAQGIKLVLLDIDNTLSVHGRDESPDAAREQVERIRAAALEPVLLSNALADRAQAFAGTLGLDVIGQANKPSTHGIDVARERYGRSAEEIVLVGDQLFTDIWAGKRAGVWTVRVDPIDPQEPWWILLKRVGERLLRKTLGYDKHYDQITTNASANQENGKSET